MNRRGIALVALAGFTLAAGAVSAGQGFDKIFNGKNLDGLTLVGVTPSAFTIEDGVLKVSGKPAGYFATKKSYGNYVLKFDWRYVRPANLQNDADFDGNSGLLVHITGEHKVWPKCVEVQLMNKDAGNIFGLGAKINGKKDADAQKAAIKPVGQWNSEEVISKDGNFTCKLNGIRVAEGTGGELKEGTIGWQSEGAEIHFRTIEIRPLP